MLKEKMCADAQLWHNLSWVSGGKFELPKCGYHFVHFDFKTSGIPMMRHIEGDNITLKNNKDEEVQTKSKNIFTPHKSRSL